MTPQDIPQELIDVLDQAAGKQHSRTGPVLAALARILMLHDEMRSVVMCSNCQERPAGAARKWCNPCYRRWLRHGRSAEGPPSSLHTGFNTFCELRDLGVSVEAAGVRAGIKRKTALAYERFRATGRRP